MTRKDFLALWPIAGAQAQSGKMGQEKPIHLPSRDIRIQPNFLNELTNYKRGFVLPEWARQGRCRQIRFDGGSMFTACQLESKWDYLFNPKTPGFVGIINAVWTLTNLYSNDLERKLDDIQSAGYNWAWVSYQLGYSFGDEARQRSQVRRLIHLAHRRGMHITAYFSLTSIFTRSAFVKDAESRTWVQEEPDGSPVAYSGIPERLMACVNKPGRLEYLMRIVKLAVEDGADDIFYDSIFNRCYCRWCQDGFREYARLVLGEALEPPRSRNRPRFGIEEQSVAGGGAVPLWGLFVEYGHYAVARALAKLDRYAKSLNPRVTISANSHQMRYVDDVTDLTWSEDSNRKGAYIDERGRLTTPMGIYAWCQAAAASQTTGQLTVAPHEYWQLQPPEYYEITTADAASFQCNFTMLAGYAFATRYEERDPVALDAWKGIGRGLRFIEANQELFEGVRPAADIAVYHSQTTSLFNSLLKQRARGEPLVQQLFAAGHPARILIDEAAMKSGAAALAREFRLIVLTGTLALSDEEVQLLNRYVTAGGRLLVSAKSASFTSFLTMRSVPPWTHSTERVKVVPYLTGSPDGLRKLISGFLNRPPFAIIEGNGYQFAVPNRKDNRVIVHMLNYDTARPLRSLRLSVSAGGNKNVEDILRPGSIVRWVSPDDSTRVLPLEWTGATARLTIPLLRVSGLMIFEFDRLK